MRKTATFFLTTALLSALLLSSSAQAQVQCKDLYPKRALASSKTKAREIKSFFVQIEEGRQLFTQVIAPSKPSKPTLLLMPGVNRSVLADEPAVQSLVDQGFGIVTFNLSTQPLSVATLPQGVKPSFMKKEYGLKDLASEVESLVTQLSAQGVQNIVPVSLSYSGAISPYLSHFKVLIDTVPLTSMAAFNPQLEQVRQSLKSAELFNPFFGPGITRRMLDESYRSQWRIQVPAISQQYNLPAERAPEMIEGYTMMSRATEGFAWTNVELKPDVRHVLVLAGGEGPSLLKNQLETFRHMLKTQQNALMYLILESGHIIPADQPKAYAGVLSEVIDGKAPTSGIVVIKPSADTRQVITREQAEAFIDSVLNSINK
jgi:hypothetical protein